MANSNETIADIVADMRGIRVREFQDYADRIEAAHKREKAAIEANALEVGGIVAATAAKSSAVGDCAKLRKALEKIVELTAPCEGLVSIELQVQAEAITALSASPRNCDVGTAEEQFKRFNEFCFLIKCRECKLYTEGYFHDCIFRWLQMPYQEKGGDNDADE